MSIAELECHEPVEKVAPKPSSGTRRIMLVEDNRDVRRLFGMMLDNEGYQVDSISGGHEAAERIDHQSPPDLVVLDRMLPGLSGDALLSRIRENAQWASVPVVVVSALRRRYEVREVLAAGANAYLPKPVRGRALVEVIEQTLAEDGRNQADDN